MTDASADGGAGEELKRRVTIQIEKTKLTATGANNTAVALFAGGTVLPAVALSFPLATAPPANAATLIAILVWGLVAMSIHWYARTLLNGLRYCSFNISLCIFRRRWLWFGSGSWPAR